MSQVPNAVVFRFEYRSYPPRPAREKPTCFEPQFTNVRVPVKILKSPRPAMEMDEDVWSMLHTSDFFSRLAVSAIDVMTKFDVGKFVPPRLPLPLPVNVNCIIGSDASAGIFARSNAKPTINAPEVFCHVVFISHFLQVEPWPVLFLCASPA
jgi:hypothetical protein